MDIAKQTQKLTTYFKTRPAYVAGTKTALTAVRRTASTKQKNAYRALISPVGAPVAASTRAKEARELLVVGLGVRHAQAEQALHVARVARQVEIHQRLEGDQTTKEM